MSQRYSGGIITANPTAPTTTSASGVWTLEQQFQNSATWPRSSTSATSRSVRFRSSASAYFNRTPSVASNRTTWTWSGWIKRGALTGTFYVFGARQLSTSAPYSLLYFASNDTLTYIDDAGSTVQTSQVFRDPSSWYHLVLSVDTTQATGANRYRMYVNGVQITSFGTATYAAQNSSTGVNAAIEHDIGIAANGSGSRVSPFDGYLTEINFIDGQALDPTYFGFFDSTGIWQPSSYTGQYGTNGFYLNFSDNSGVTATTIGKDYSGNGNNWTPNIISVTAGVTYDSMLDVPVNYADGGNGRGNYAVLNPLAANSAVTAAQGNLSYTSSNDRIIKSTISITSGKWYWEFAPGGGGSTSGCGVLNPSVNIYAVVNLNIATAGVSYLGNGNKSVNGTASSYGATYTSGNTIGVALDLDTNAITFYKDNTSQGSISITSGLEWCPAFDQNTGTNYVNFGQRPFAYTPPTGFKALNTQNLPAPTISNGANYMAATTYTGTGSSLAVSNAVNGISFAPDFVWVKSRPQARSHRLLDTIRGVGNTLFSDQTAAETVNANGVTAFNSNGFTVGTDINYNNSAEAYVGWQWKAGGTAVSNTAGSITSSVSANTTAGFSVVTWTGNGTNGATVGHGLGVAPKMVIVKRRSAIESWGVYHASLPSAAYYLILNSTAAQDGTGGTIWNSTAPSSTVLTLGTSTYSNANTSTYVAYCFAEVAGYSKFGSYTGTNTSDGQFVYCGFRPRWIMVKAVTTQYATTDWSIVDTARESYNINRSLLRANTSAVEDTSIVADIDILSNGFKLRYSPNETNGPNTYIFAAFAENPFKTSRAR